MPRQTEAPPIDQYLNDLLVASDDAISADDAAGILQDIRGQADDPKAVDRFLLAKARQGEMQKVKFSKLHKEVEAQIKKLAAGPLRPVRVVGIEAQTASGKQIRVSDGRSEQVVPTMNEIDVEKIDVGDEVYLNADRTAIVALSSQSRPATAQVATFEQYLDGQLLLKYRDDSTTAHQSKALAQITLRHGDQVLYDPDVGMAYCKAPQDGGDDLLIEDCPTETFDDVGGLDDVVELLKQCFLLHSEYRDLSAQYLIKSGGSVLLCGPTGNGKTLLARACARYLQDLSGAERSIFIAVKPGSWRSKWYGETEKNIRNLFAKAQRLSKKHPNTPVVIFLDEIDSVGAARDGQSMSVDNRTVQALLSELDGFDARGNIWIIAATNRIDAMDPALLRPGRLGDHIIDVPRPNATAAKQILAAHLKITIPYAPNGHGDDKAATRGAMIDAAIAHLYSPNEDGVLGKVHFRDSTQRSIERRSMVNGAILAGAVKCAAERAVQRHIESGQPGVKAIDVLDALEVQIAAAVKVLSPANCHHHLDLPDDADIVRIEKRKQRSVAPYKYIDLH